MNEQNLVKDALARLRGQFGARLLQFPPISSDAFRRLEEIIGELPSDLTVFLNSCNGLRVDVAGREDVHIWGTPEVMASVVDPSSAIVPKCFLPFRGDPTGERDWVITEFKPAFGAVVRWDPWTPTIQLVASSFGHYLNAWVEYLMACYGSDGNALPSRPQGTFEIQWNKNDPRLAKLGSEPIVTEWLSRIAEAATCNGAECKAAMRLRYALCGPIFRNPTANSISVSK